MINKVPCNVAAISPREANLKKRIRRHLSELGFHNTRDGKLEIASSGKDVIRALHASQRDDRLSLNRFFLKDRGPKLPKYFAFGTK